MKECNNNSDDDDDDDGDDDDIFFLAQQMDHQAEVFVQKPEDHFLDMWNPNKTQTLWHMPVNIELLQHDGR